MTNERNGALIAGVVLLFGSLLVPLVVWSVNAGSFEDIVAGLIITVILSPLLFFVGLVMVIIGMARRGRQQQQQQVVLMSGSQARAQGFVEAAACPHCSGGLGGGERFCIHCGRRVDVG